MKRFSTAWFRNIFLVALVLTTTFILLFYKNGDVASIIRDGIAAQKQVPSGKVNKHTKLPVAERLDMSKNECRMIFPDLFMDVDYAASNGKFVLEKDEGDYTGLVQGRIKDNKVRHLQRFTATTSAFQRKNLLTIPTQLYILTTAPSLVPQILHQRTAILSQLHRALITSPTPLPDTPFAFVVNDSPRNNSWAFARPNKNGPYNIFLMPSFAFWSWPAPTLGAFDAVLSRISTLEATTPFERKIDKAVWRGTPWFNPLGHPRLRQDLLKATQNREWADVAALNTHAHASNKLAMEEFCRYKYVVYTEGVTYSGRLPYHQACGSVVVSAPLTYLTQTAWFLRPIAAGELIAGLGGGKGARRRKSEGEGLTMPLLGTVKDWREANAIYVSPRFDDLEEVIMVLRAHPEVARRIARNQREAVVERGYLSGAAEACYWRALVEAWARSVVVRDEWAEEMGERYETWLLKQMSTTSGKTPGKAGG
ncbi:hypothetical protein SLS60_006418 [Paraconiothyrium brasiliense]|uniref:Glycosyl transferase CAP10 domain-containing protein n=1 Tax=Paraconiothyrium brasiliense TaxID=300254 RepID=A0ABR3RB36_9PLEO